MANRYQNRPFPADDDYGRDAQPRAKGEGDPLAELARLIGQNDPFASNTRAAPAPRQAEPAYQDEHDYQEEPVQPGPPPWMQRAAAYEPPQHDLEDRHPVQRYGAQHQEPQYEEPQHLDSGADYHQAPAFAAHTDHQAHGQYDQAYEQPDPNRYDDALYGHAEGARAQHPHDEQYQDDPYAYQDGYAEQEEAPKRRGGMATVAVVLALAVVGTGAAFAYRSFMGSSRSGEPPVIKAEPGPNKIVPPSATASADGKPIQDRLGGAAPERLVSREEQPVNVQDATKAGGPRVVFPPLNQNANPPSTASVSPSNKPMVGNGAMQNGDEPRKIRTFAVKGDQSDAGATPAARQVPNRIGAPAAAPTAAPAAAPRATNANASVNAPMSLSPQAAPPTAAPAPSRMASTNPTQQAAPVASGGGYVVQISSQRSEGDAQASFRALQGKFPSVLGSRNPLIKKADLGDKGTYYRAMVGPFGSQDEASQLCGNLKSAGGQCVVQRN